MNKFKIIQAVLCLLALHHAHTVNGKEFKSFIQKILHRQKREWSYPDMTVSETDPGHVKFFKTKTLLTIKSNNPAAKTYIFNPVPTKFEMKPNGTVYQTQPLDREEKSQYILKAEALDENGQQVELPVDLVINVGDVNDNAPIFDQTTMSGNVDEDFKIGSFMTLLANDADSSENNYNKVTYTYLGGENPSAPGDVPRFGISPDGKVTVVGNLDAESVPVVTFLVLASDVEPELLHQETTGTVTVTINDANDHAPVFISTPYKIDVPESTQVQNALITMEATDGDKGINKAVTFEILRGNEDGKFSIKSYPNINGASSAEIILDNMLDYESGVTSYTLTVEGYNADASNKNDPMYRTTTTVQINVVDVNEPPVFINQPYLASVTENQAPISNWFTVTAVDRDFGGTQDIRYSQLNGQEWFSIDESTGVITVANGVDRESPLVDDATNIFTLKIQATDNGSPALTSTPVDIEVTVVDVNDNAPKIKQTLYNVCEKPNSNSVGNLTILDADTRSNGPTFTYTSMDSNWIVESTSDYTAELLTTITQFDATNNPKHLVEVRIQDTQGLSGTSTVTVSVCSCDANGVCSNAVPVAAGFPVPVLVAVIAAMLILLIIVLAVVAYRRRQKADLEKQALFIDDDDVRENLQAYHDEGGGEEDNDGYDISALQAPPLNKPRRVDEKPLGAQMPPRTRVPPDTDIGDYINDAKQQADNDPTAPPFDSLLVFDYEGQGSDAGSLSSLNSGTTDGSQDYNYLNNWGPRFKKLADMYGGGEDEE